NNAKKAKTAASVSITATQEQGPSSVDNSVNNGMDSGILPSAAMLLHTSESHQQNPPSDSPMNQYSDIYAPRPANNKSNKRKLDELGDPSSAEFASSPSVKPQKTEQAEPERSLSRTGTPLSNGPSGRNGSDIGSGSYEFAPPTQNTGRATPNSSLLTRQTPPPPSLQQQQSHPPPSSYMSMSPRNQYTVTSDSPFLQTNNQVFVFTTQLANEAAESVLKNEHPNIIEYHKSLPTTAQYISTLSNNNHNSLLGGPIHMNPRTGCPSPRSMQMMMPGPPHHSPHIPLHNGNNGPPPNWPHPHYHQQQPPFGRLTPGSGGLPPPSHLLPPGPMMMNGSPPPPGMRMGGMPPMPGMGQPSPDSIDNLTPERIKHRKNQLDKIQEIKSKITGGRGRGGRGKANAAAVANMPPSMNGGPLDPHQQQMMMMNSPHSIGPPHHMMGIGPPPPPHMLPPGMRGPDGMMLDMNGAPPLPHGYMNGPMPPGFHGQFGPGPGDSYGPLPPHHPQSQAVRDWNRMQIEHLEGKAHQMRGHPPPYCPTSPSSMTPPIASTSMGGSLGVNGKLISPRMDPSAMPRLYKVGQPEKFIPDSLPSGNKKLPGDVGEVQLTASPTQMDYNEFGMEGEELIITRHLNRAYRPGNGTSGGPGSSSSCKDEPLTPSGRSNSTPHNNSNVLPSGQPSSQQQQQQQQLSGSTTPTHHPQGMIPQSVPAASPRSSKLTSNNNLSSPLMMSNTNSAKDEPLDINSDPKTPTSNMAPPLSSMLQMANSLQSSSSPYNPSSNQSSKQSMNSPSLPHMSKSMDHANMPPQHMQFQNMNPHHRMLGPPDSMPPHFNPHHPGNFPPPHPHMYKMMPP
ncbi:unnamed protein product, partial [Adineta ricciae]